MKIRIKAITNMEELRPIATEFDNFVQRWSDNPFLLSAFIAESANLCRSKGSKPLIIILYYSNTIIGIAPLEVYRKLEVTSANFLFGPHFLPDIIVDEKYRDICFTSLLKYLFSTLNLCCINLTFSNESPNLPILRQLSKKMHVYYGEKESFAHRVIQVNYTWNEYFARRGSNFRNRFRKIERKLDRFGNKNIVCTEKMDETMDICKKILEIEQKSWKARWMSNQGITEDIELLMLLSTISNVKENNSKFHWRAYILQLNNHDIAYVLVFRNKHTWFVKRTSYDEHYKALYPGLFIMNYTIQDLFSEPHSKLIDFCTDHGYLEVWAKKRLDRTVLILSKSSMLSLAAHVRSNPCLRRISDIALKYIPKSLFNLL